VLLALALDLESQKEKKRKLQDLLFASPPPLHFSNEKWPRLYVSLISSSFQETLTLSSSLTLLSFETQWDWVCETQKGRKNRLPIPLLFSLSSPRDGVTN